MITGFSSSSGACGRQGAAERDREGHGEAGFVAGREGREAGGQRRSDLGNAGLTDAVSSATSTAKVRPISVMHLITPNIEVASRPNASPASVDGRTRRSIRSKGSRRNIVKSSE